MASIKTETITVWIKPTVKAALKMMVEQQRRSLANMVEVMIRDYCAKNGISINSHSKART